MLKARLLGKVLSCHTKVLSCAGRVQLIISVLASIHVLVYNFLYYQRKVLKEIDGVLRKILWNGPEVGRSNAKVASDDVCMPTSDAGGGGW